MSKIKKDTFYGIIDQGLISVSNLGIGLFLINFASKENYGLYGIGFSAILLAVGVMNALITTQMSVNLPQKDPTDKSRYCFSMLSAQSLILIPVWLIFEMTISGVYYFKLVSKDLFIFMSIIGFSVFGSLFHEFLRSYFYSALSPLRVMQIDIVNITFIFSGLVLVYILKFNSLHIWTVGLYGCSALIAGLVGLKLSNMLQKVTVVLVINAFKEAWVHGRWALGGVIVTWFQSQGYVALLSILAATESIAEANAAKLFLAPASIIGSSLGRVFVPRLALLRSDNKHKEVRKMAARILSFIMIVITAIACVVYLIKDQIIKSYFSKEYANIGPLIMLWSIVFILQAARSNASILLMIYKKFRIITLCNTVTAVFTILAGILLIKTYGIPGSIVATASGELLLALMLWNAFRAYKVDLN